jgi:hypothetical protein
MKRVRKPSAPVAAVGAEVMAAVVAAEAVVAIAADVVVAAADAAEIAATVATAATAGKFTASPLFVIEPFFDFGCTGFAPEVFAFEPHPAHKIHSPAEFLLANPLPSV